MREPGTRMTIDLRRFEKGGLYLLLQDARLPRRTIDLSRANIERTADMFWNSPKRLPPKVKSATTFQRCLTCPLKECGGICTAIRPILPLLATVDDRLSCDRVTAIYRDDTSGLLSISETDMQTALKYVSILSLMRYCEMGKGYWKYFWGLNPLMRGRDFARRLYLNVFWIQKGNMARVQRFVDAFRNVVMMACKNQIARLQLLCKKDALMNAFVNTQIVTELLATNIEEALGASFDVFGEMGGGKQG
jgi:hypothetical protein